MATHPHPNYTTRNNQPMNGDRKKRKMNDDYGIFYNYTGDSENSSMSNPSIQNSNSKSGKDPESLSLRISSLSK